MINYNNKNPRKSNESSLISLFAILAQKWAKFAAQKKLIFWSSPLIIDGSRSRLALLRKPYSISLCTDFVFHCPCNGSASTYWRRYVRTCKVKISSSILLCKLGDLAGGGSMALAVGVSDMCRWQVKRFTWHVIPDTWLLIVNLLSIHFLVTMLLSADVDLIFKNLTLHTLIHTAMDHQILNIAYYKYKLLQSLADTLFPFYCQYCQYWQCCH